MINIFQIKNLEEDLKNQFNSAKPFRYLVIEDFLEETFAQKLYDEFPQHDPKTWVNANGYHQKNKYTQPCPENSSARDYFDEVTSQEFMEVLQRITGIEGLLADPNLFGAGYHQTLEGGFLDVHIDFNKRRNSNLDRRLNLIVYFCRDWKEEHGGNVELWDMTRKTQIADIPPLYNRAVMFETNEISWHGHPKPWHSKNHESRKSLSVYYYSMGRQDTQPQEWHNTIYVNTQGVRGVIKNILSGIKYFPKSIKQHLALKPNSER